MPDDCWCCRLALGDRELRETRWFYLGNEGIVVEDRNPKRWDLRLLFVSAEHFHCGQEPSWLWDTATRLLLGVANALVAEHPHLELGDFDYHRHSYRRHWHAQLGLRRRGEGN